VFGKRILRGSQMYILTLSFNPARFSRQASM
jgi:hypothetical protein